MGSSRQEYWSVLPCPPPADLPDSAIESMSVMSSALADRFFTTSTTWEDHGAGRRSQLVHVPDFALKHHNLKTHLFYGMSGGGGNTFLMPGVSRLLRPPEIPLWWTQHGWVHPHMTDGFLFQESEHCKGMSSGVTSSKAKLVFHGILGII